MNRNIVSALALVSMLALLGGCNEEAKPQKPVPQFGVVQISKLYQETKLGKQGIARVGELENKAMAVLTDLLLQVGQHGHGLVFQQKDKNEAEVQRLQKQLQSRVYFLQNVIKQDQEHVMNVMQTEMKKAFEKCQTEHGLFGLFSDEVMPSYAPEVDMTEAVKAILDADPATFGELPSLEKPALPEPGNASAPADKASGDSAKAAAPKAAAPAEKAAAPKAAAPAEKAPAAK